MRETLITAAGSRGETGGVMDARQVVEGYRERGSARRARLVRAAQSTSQDDAATPLAS